MPKLSTITEWSMTRSTGLSGLIFSGSPPSLVMASRIAARSTTAGTPVKSCIRTRAGRKLISCSDRALVFQPGGDGLRGRPGRPSAVFVAQQVFQQHLHRDGQARDAGQTGFLGGRRGCNKRRSSRPTASSRRVWKLSFDGMEGRLSLFRAARKPVAGSRAVTSRTHSVRPCARVEPRAAAVLIAPLAPVASSTRWRRTAR